MLLITLLSRESIQNDGPNYKQKSHPAQQNCSQTRCISIPLRFNPDNPVVILGEATAGPKQKIAILSEAKFGPKQQIVILSEAKDPLPLLPLLLSFCLSFQQGICCSPSRLHSSQYQASKRREQGPSGS
jgi:hypothetical protein